MLESYISDLADRLKDRDYAGRYGAELAKLDLAKTLMRVRTEARLTQKELSERLEVSQPYVAKLESGEANPTLASIGKMLAALGLRLVTGTESLVPEEDSMGALPPHIRLETAFGYLNTTSGGAVNIGLAGSAEAGTVVAFRPPFGLRDLVEVAGAE